MTKEKSKPEPESKPEITPEVPEPLVLSEMDQLKEQLQESEKTKDEYLTLIKSTRADFENYQKRILRDQANEKRFAHFQFTADILPALDNLDRALQAAKAGGDNGSMVQGVSMVLSQVLDVFKRHGIQRIQAEGHSFDPNLHQAVMQVPSKDLPVSTVIQVLENGYTLHDRVIRPASVSISSAPSE